MPLSTTWLSPKIFSSTPTTPMPRASDRFGSSAPSGRLRFPSAILPGPPAKSTRSIRRPRLFGKNNPSGRDEEKENRLAREKYFGRSAGAGLTLNHHPGPALFHSLFRRRCSGGDSRPRLSGREKLDGFFATTNATNA